jgi:hypothetical protein
MNESALEMLKRKARKKKLKKKLKQPRKNKWKEREWNMFV